MRLQAVAQQLAGELRVAERVFALECDERRAARVAERLGGQFLARGVQAVRNRQAEPQPRASV